MLSRTLTARPLLILDSSSGTIQVGTSVALTFAAIAATAVVVVVAVAAAVAVIWAILILHLSIFSSFRTTQPFGETVETEIP